jgi:very-short-patch-repair endonuclease
MLPFNKKLKGLARELRKRMTDAELVLWGKIRKKELKGYQFYRQKNIGNYIVDFYCPAAKLIIEIDGGQHYSEVGLERDKTRDNYLMSLGFTVLRFSDRDIFKNIDGMLQRIWEYIENPPLIPPLKRGEIDKSPLYKMDNYLLEEIILSHVYSVRRNI